MKDSSDLGFLDSVKEYFLGKTVTPRTVYFLTSWLFWNWELLYFLLTSQMKAVDTIITAKSTFYHLEYIFIYPTLTYLFFLVTFSTVKFAGKISINWVDSKLGSFWDKIVHKVIPISPDEFSELKRKYNIAIEALSNDTKNLMREHEQVIQEKNDLQKILHDIESKRVNPIHELLSLTKLMRAKPEAVFTILGIFEKLAIEKLGSLSIAEISDLNKGKMPENHVHALVEDLTRKKVLQASSDHSGNVRYKLHKRVEEDLAH